MKLAASLFFAASAFAQTVTISGPTGSVKSGATVGITIAVTASTGMAATQGTVGIPAGWSATCTIGSQLAVNKVVSCYPTANGLLYLVYGPNTTALADGTLLTVNLTVPATASTSVISIPLTTALGATPPGDPVAVTVAGSPFALSVTASPTCDIDANGVINAGDVTAIANKIGSGQNSNDLNGDGVTNIVDLQRVANAVQTGTCRTGA